jgi:two-component sensor histidine kinase
MVDPAPRRARSWRLRWHLALLSLVLLVPMLAAMAALGLVQARARHDHMVTMARGLARHVMADVDAAMQAQFSMLSGIAAALPSAPDASRAQLAAVSRATGLALALHGEDGVALGPRDDTGCEAAAILPLPARRGVTGLLQCAAGGAPFVLAFASAPEGGAVSARLDPALLREPLIRAGLFPEQGAALADADGIILARWQDHDRFLGHSMPAAARHALATGEVWEGRNLAGDRVLVAHATSDLTGWAVGFGVLKTDLGGPLRGALLTLGPIAAGLIVLAVFGTAVLARRIERPVADLAAAAAAYGRGEMPAPPRGSIAEVDSVADSLAAAARAAQETEGRRQLMLQEMQHRVKNMLAAVQSVAALSARGAGDAQEFARGFGARLRAMAEAHALLMAEGSSQAPLRLLLARELDPYARQGGGTRILQDGPEVMLSADAAIALGLVVHELATNAAKHGALSRDEGRVGIRWTTREEQTGTRLTLHWDESGGPPVPGPPTQQGFGSRLLRQVLGGRLHGHTALEWRPEGLRARLELLVAPKAAG